MTMRSKTKIIVLHLKELIYTGIFVILGILFLILLLIMFLPNKKTEDSGSAETAAQYLPGKYTTSLLFNDSTVDVEVVVDSNNINAIRLVNLDETVTTMYPLMEPTLEELAGQIVEKQSLAEISYSEDNKYTSMLLLDAIKASLQKATLSENSVQ